MKLQKSGALSLVDVKKVQAAFHKLKDINWLYGNLDDECLDDVAKKVVETANSATSTMEEATNEDILGYTIQNMNSNLNKGSDIQQYKMTHVREATDRCTWMSCAFPLCFQLGDLESIIPGQ